MEVMVDAVAEIKAGIDGRIAELCDELERLEAASSALIGPQVAERRTPARRRARTRRAPARAQAKASGGGKGPAGSTRAAVLDALAGSDRPLTAGEVAELKGLGRPTVSTTLSKLARSGEVLKAERGYALKG